MGLLGYKEIVEAAPEDTSVKASDDAIMLRYLCGALKNNTLSAHISRTYASKGREAWQYLKTEFGLKRITQTTIRVSLIKLEFTAHQDARLCVMLFERIAGRIQTWKRQSYYLTKYHPSLAT